jgi:hypothetical protein
MKQTLLVLGGALVGGLVGHFAFVWLTHKGLYALVLPGGLLGLGAGVARNRSIWVAAACGIAAVAVGLVSDWHFEHFKNDPSLGYFLLHVHQLDAVTLVMIAAGGAIGFWVPYSRIERRSPGTGRGSKQDGPS